MTVTIHTPAIAPIDDSLLQRWREVPVPVAVDLSPDEYQISPELRPLLPPGQQPRLFGRALTVRCAPPDFGAVLHAVGMIGAGEVLVIEAAGQAEHAMIGDVLGGHLHRVGAAGIVCDGPVRDVGNLAKMQGLSVYSRSVTPRGPTGAVLGEVNCPVRIGGATVNPGDLILGDCDGLVAIPATALEGLIRRMEEKVALEETWVARLASDEPVTSIFGLV